jgi:peptide/nickel transport system substrate-binding protein
VAVVRRRGFLGAAGALAAPSLVRAEATRVLKFIPQSDVTVLDPIFTTAYVTRNHGYLVFDTLFGQDGNYRPTLQMLEAAVTENDGRQWRLTLRQGLMFHDGTPVLARDCVASLKRWMKRDAFGGALAEVTDELSAADDRVILFRLRKPFPLLPDALGKTSTLMPAIMPERLAGTDAFKQVTEMVGSGPYRFKRDERVVGSRAVYERFDGYVPRTGGNPDWTSGPKVAHFDRVEWLVIPDESTAAAALQTGEADWWEYPTVDLLPLLAKNPKVRTRIPDMTGSICFARLNHLHPPFDNPDIRRALLGAVNQADFMTAVAGPERRMWREGVGVFCPDTPMANDAGLEVLTGKRDMAAVRAAIAAAGYRGEPAAVLSASDFPFRRALAEVGADMLTKAGLKVDLQSVDWGTLVQRRESKAPVSQGGWSMIITNLSGVDLATPAGHAFRGTGPKAWFGWPTSPKIEELRGAWLDAPDVASQRRLCIEIQRQFWVDVPHIPVGQYYQPTTFRSDLTGMQDGFAMFWNIRRLA